MIHVNSEIKVLEGNSSTNKLNNYYDIIYLCYVRVIDLTWPIPCSVFQMKKYLCCHTTLIQQTSASTKLFILIPMSNLSTSGTATLAGDDHILDVCMRVICTLSANENETLFVTLAVVITGDKRCLLFTTVLTCYKTLVMLKVLYRSEATL